MIRHFKTVVITFFSERGKFALQFQPGVTFKHGEVKGLFWGRKNKLIQKVMCERVNIFQI